MTTACRFCLACSLADTTVEYDLSYASVLASGTSSWGAFWDGVKGSSEQKFDAFLNVWCSKCKRLSVNVFPAVRSGQVDYRVVSAHVTHMQELFRSIED